jgi:uncharacterized protein (DUF433 family)
MKTPRLDVLEVPNYGIPEAAAYLHVPISTLRYWTVGEDALIKLATDSHKPLLSFKNLVECYVLELLRVSHKVKLRALRYSLRTAFEKYPSKHPFADYNVSTRNNHVYIHEDPIVDLSRGGQLVFSAILGSSLRRVVRNEKGLALQLFPFTRKSQLLEEAPSPEVVVINPKVAFGLPVLAESRISTAFLASRYRGGDSVLEIAKDYGRSEREIEEALIWEGAKAA